MTSPEIEEIEIAPPLPAILDPKDEDENERESTGKWVVVSVVIFPEREEIVIAPPLPAVLKPESEYESEPE